MRRYIQFIIAIVALLVQDGLIAQEWSTLHLSEARKELCACAHGDKIYFAGGQRAILYDIVDILDTRDNTWTTAHLSAGKTNMRCEVIGDKIYFTGSASFPDGLIMDIYDVSTNVWSTTRGPNVAGGEMTSNGQYILRAKFDELDVYDTTSDTWTTYVLSPKREDVGMVSIGDKVYIAGGNFFGDDFDEVSIFDVSTKTWSEDFLTEEREGLTGLRYHKTAYFGIHNFDDDIDRNPRIHIYDSEVDHWSIDSFPTQNRMRISSYQYHGKLYYAGGQIIRLDDQLIDSIDIFDIPTESWSTINMPTGRINSTIIGHGNKLYIAGGTAEDDTVFNGDFYTTDVIEVLKLADVLICTDENYSAADIVLDDIHVNAEEEITLSGVQIGTNANVLFNAGVRITFAPSFDMIPGSTLFADIETCVHE